MSAKAHACRSENNDQEPFLSFFLGLGSRHLYLLSHLTGQGKELFLYMSDFFAWLRTLNTWLKLKSCLINVELNDGWAEKKKEGVGVWGWRQNKQDCCNCASISPSGRWEGRLRLAVWVYGLWSLKYQKATKKRYLVDKGNLTFCSRKGPRRGALALLSTGSWAQFFPFGSIECIREHRPFWRPG